MTQRTELQHRMLEMKSRMMSRVGNKLFTFKQTGLDGFIKRQMLTPKGPSTKSKG